MGGARLVCSAGARAFGAGWEGASAGRGGGNGGDAAVDALETSRVDRVTPDSLAGVVEQSLALEVAVVGGRCERRMRTAVSHDNRMVTRHIYGALFCVKRERSCALKLVAR